MYTESDQQIAYRMARKAYIAALEAVEVRSQGRTLPDDANEQAIALYYEEEDTIALECGVYDALAGLRLAENNLFAWALAKAQELPQYATHKEQLARIENYDRLSRTFRERLAEICMRLLP